MNSFNSIKSVGFLAILTSCTTNPQKMDIQAPKAKIIPQTLEIHGDRRIDNYFWMNERDHPDVLSYLNEENTYTKQMMSATEALQETIFNEIVGRIKADDNSVPYLKNGYFYYSRYEKGKEYPIFCRKKENLEADEEIILDGNLLAEGKDFLSIGALSIAKNNQFLAYSIDDVSRRQYKIFIKDLASGKLSETFINETTGSIVWANDNKTIYYVKKDASLRAYQIWKSSWDENGFSEDALVYEEKDPTFSVGIDKSKSGDFLMIHSSSTTTDHWQILNLNDAASEWVDFTERRKGLEYNIDFDGKDFYILTNKEAQNFQLMRCEMKAHDEKNWQVFIPHDKDVLLDNFELFENAVVTEEKFKANSRIQQFDKSGRKIREIEFEDAVFTVYLGRTPELSSSTFRVEYTSLNRPNSTYDVSLADGSLELKKQQEIVGGFNPDDYQSERLWVKAADGTEIPVSLVYKKALFKKGNNPCLIYGYGSYGYSIDPYFSISRLSLLDRGFVFAIAHIRGGQEMGRHWYEQGKLLHKMNTFTDFISCSQSLIDRGFSHSDKLFAMGGSAGGLLMGTVMNLAPQLYNGIVAAVPFVDVVTTMLDESIPLTTGEFDEWGNPKNEVFYQYIKAYSPYDQVEAKDYPNLLVTTGYHDSQVQYWEPAKWVAKLRELKTNNNLLLFHTNMEAGHSGKSGRYQMHRETALEYAFFVELANDKL